MSALPPVTTVRRSTWAAQREPATAHSCIVVEVFVARSRLAGGILIALFALATVPATWFSAAGDPGPKGATTASASGQVTAKP